MKTKTEQHELAETGSLAAYRRMSRLPPRLLPAPASGLRGFESHPPHHFTSKLARFNEERV